MEELLTVAPRREVARRLANRQSENPGVLTAEGRR